MLMVLSKEDNGPFPFLSLYGWFVVLILGTIIASCSYEFIYLTYLYPGYLEQPTLGGLQ